MKGFNLGRLVERDPPLRTRGGERLRVLLTGFGPFPGIAVNASGRLVAELARTAARAHPDIEILTDVLPTQWQAGPDRLERLIGNGQPHVALHFGVAPATPGFRLETRAENAALLHADAMGDLPRLERINAWGPSQLRSTFPVPAIQARLEQMGLPVETSNDAGKYLCNAALYHSLTLAQRAHVPRLTGFVHIPSDLLAACGAASAPGSSTPELDWERALRGAMAIVEVCLAHARERTGSPV